MKLGNSAVVENNSAPTNIPNRVQATKLRFLARSRWKNGCSTVTVCSMNRIKATMATPASIQISVEPNQSWLEPRSIISWNEPIKVARVANPRKSNGLCRPPRSRAMNRYTPRKARMPIGRLM